MFELVVSYDSAAGEGHQLGWFPSSIRRATLASPGAIASLAPGVTPSAQPSKQTRVLDPPLTHVTISAIRAGSGGVVSYGVSRAPDVSPAPRFQRLLTDSDVFEHLQADVYLGGAGEPCAARHGFAPSTFGPQTWCAAPGAGTTDSYQAAKPGAADGPAFQSLLGQQQGLGVTTRISMTAPGAGEVDFSGGENDSTERSSVVAIPDPAGRPDAPDKRALAASQSLKNWADPVGAELNTMIC